MIFSMAASSGVVCNNPERTLIVSGGDNYQGLAVSNLLRGEPVMKVFDMRGRESGGFEPSGHATRAEAAAVLERVLDYINR